MLFLTCNSDYIMLYQNKSGVRLATCPLFLRVRTGATHLRCNLVFSSPWRSRLPFFRAHGYFSAVKWLVFHQQFQQCVWHGPSPSAFSTFHSFLPLSLQHIGLFLFLCCHRSSCSCTDLGALLELFWVSMFSNTCSLKRDYRIPRFLWRERPIKGRSPYPHCEQWRTHIEMSGCNLGSQQLENRHTAPCKNIHTVYIQLLKES